MIGNRYSPRFHTGSTPKREYAKNVLTYLIRPGLCNETERYTKQQFVRLFQDLVTIIEKRFVSLFDIIRKLYK